MYAGTNWHGMTSNILCTTKNSQYIGTILSRLEQDHCIVEISAHSHNFLESQRACSGFPSTHISKYRLSRKLISRRLDLLERIASIFKNMLIYFLRPLVIQVQLLNAARYVPSSNLLNFMKINHNRPFSANKFSERDSWYPGRQLLRRMNNRKPNSWVCFSLLRYLFLPGKKPVSSKEK